jgi:transmembrane sensor
MNNTNENHHIIEQASHWAVLYDDGELSTKQKNELTYWLLESPVHVKEFLHACVIFDVLEGIDINKKISVDALIEKINLPTFDVLPLDNVGKNTSLIEKSNHKKRMSKVWIALAASVTLSLFSSYGLHFSTEDNANIVNSKTSNKFITVLGEQRSVTLSDGSIVYLNTLTNIDIDYNPHFRNIHLYQGEAIFKVAHNPEKPFRVWVGGVMFQALGTEFNVRNNRGKIELTVITGEVALTNQANNNENLVIEQDTLRLAESSALDLNMTKTLIVSIGQEASVQPNGVITTGINADLDNKTSWKQRKLIFKNDSLKDVIYEFNRYNLLQISIESEVLSRLPISGMFESNDPNSLLEFLKSSGKAKIQKQGLNKVSIDLL